VQASARVNGLLLAGVDSLVVGWPVDFFKFPEEERQTLRAAKEAAGKKLFGSDGAAFTWYGQDFSMKASGAKGYEWIFENGDLNVRLAAEARGGKVFPEVYVKFGSGFLWREGHENAWKATQDWLSTWAAIGGGKVSRADLCSDFAIPLPEIDLCSELVSRGRKRGKRAEVDMSEVADWQTGRKGTGYQVGKGDLMARIYDKREELLHTKKLWFEGLWRENGWDGDAPVTRFEFQFRRKALKEFNVDSPQDLEWQKRELWGYATEEWMTVRECSEDTNRARWPVKPFWEDVQAVGASFGTRTGITRFALSRPKYAMLLEQWRGLTKTMIALDMNTLGPEDRAWKHLDAAYDAIKKDPAFRAETRQRAARLSYMEVPGLKGH
jgi:hypothetical protein